MPLASPMMRSHVFVRLVMAMCALALLATAIVGSAEPAVGSTVNQRIASVRSSQVYAQKAMLSQDALIARLKAQRKAVNKLLKQAERELNAARNELASAKAVAQERRDRLARVNAEYANPNDAPAPDIYRARLRDIAREIRVADRRKENMANRERAMLRAVRSKKSQIANLVRQRKLAVSRRNSAAASLAASIIQMRGLAAIKAEEQSTVSLAGGEGVFSWPTTGRIVQSYGCTGFKLNPRKGSCAHFHDGIDVVSGYGTPVRSVAPGVVAYSGWNPWDKEGRAWVVDVMHADGFMSRYGHLIATERVRAGELVHTGQVIGKMGNTGKSTGTHLHFELLARDKDVNPVSYLPAGVVRVDKTSTKAGQAAKGQKARAEALAKARAQAKADRARRRAQAKRERQEAQRRAAEEAAAAVAKCQPSSSTLAAGDGGSRVLIDNGRGGKACVVLPALRGGSEDGSPGLPLPYRGTSPAPG